MKIKVISDCHKNGPDPVDCLFELGPNIIYIGDNHELKNIPMEGVEKRIAEFHKFVIDCRNTDTHIIPGNHEVVYGLICCTAKEVIREINGKRVLFSHGDKILWPLERYRRWSLMEPGAGKFKIAISKMGSKLRRFISPSRLSKKKLDKLAAHAKSLGCDTIVVGHTHPKKLIDVVHDDIRIINVPRGMTEIEI